MPLDWRGACFEFGIRVPLQKWKEHPKQRQIELAGNSKRSGEEILKDVQQFIPDF
jgi:hypothetical protein